MTGNEEKTSQTLDQIQRTILRLVNSGNYIEARRFIGIMLRHIFTGMLTALQNPFSRSFVVHFDCFLRNRLILSNFFSGLSTVKDNMNHPAACTDQKNKASLSLMEAAMSQTINLIGINRFAALFDLSISKKPSTFLKMGVSTGDENSFTLADRMEMASQNGCFAVYRSKVIFIFFTLVHE